MMLVAPPGTASNWTRRAEQAAEGLNALAPCVHSVGGCAGGLSCADGIPVVGCLANIWDKEQREDCLLG